MGERLSSDCFVQFGQSAGPEGEGVVDVARGKGVLGEGSGHVDDLAGCVGLGMEILWTQEEGWRSTKSPPPEHLPHHEIPHLLYHEIDILCTNVALGGWCSVGVGKLCGLPHTTSTTTEHLVGVDP
eukprot:gene22732-biopygen8193